MRKSEILNLNSMLILLDAAVIGVFLIGMPKYVDDISFLEFIGGWFREQDVAFPDSGGNIFNYGIPMKDIFHSWAEHWRYDNLRLGNILVFFFLLLPKWIGSGIATVVWIYCMTASFRLAGTDMHKSATVLFGLILWGIFLPWSNRMGSLVYQFNYILGTGAALYFLEILKRSGSKVYLLIWGFIAGAWQEAFSIPIAGGLIFLMLINSGFRTARWKLALAGLITGILCIVISQGTYLRITGYVHLENEVLISKVKYLFAFNLLFYAFLFFVAYSVWKKKNKEIVFDPLIIFCIISGLVPVFILALVYSEPRVTWWTQIVSVIGLLHLLNSYYGNYWKRYSFKNMIWLIPAGLVVLLHFVVSDIYALKMRKTFKDSVTAYVKNPTKQIFTDIYTVKDQPWICFKMPDVLFYGGTHDFMPYFLSQWSDDTNFRMIPRELRNTTSKSGRLLKGDGFREYNGRLVIDGNKLELCNCMNIRFEADYGNGYREVSGHSFSFVSEADGKNYYYVHLMSPWYLQHFGEIKGVKVKK